MARAINDNLRCALLYRKQGFSIIPLKKDKKPYFPWTEYQTRVATEKEIRDWFEEYPDANIGIITGEVSGIVVIDVDASHGGMNTIQGLQMPDTPVVLTGGGGLHFYCKHPGDKKISNFQAREDLPGVDLRGDGGYVVAPPSTHQSGRDYAWEDGREIDSKPLAELPDWAYTEVGEKTPVKDLYSGVGAGNRNQSLARIVGSWVSDKLSIKECIELAEVWNERNNPPMPQHELERTVKSIYEKHYGGMDSFDSKAVLQIGRELKKLDVKIEWCVDRLIPKGAITLLTGRGGIGKTFLCMQIADAVSKGKQFMGLKTIKMPVTYVDFENALPILIDRIRQLGSDDVAFWHTTNAVQSPPKLDSNQYDMYKMLPKGLIIFDTLRASHNKDENESKDMAMIMSRLKEIRDLGYTVIILHHTSKADTIRAKGSTAIPDLSDQCLTLSDVSQCKKCRGTGMIGFGKSEKECPACNGTGELGMDKYLRIGTQGKTRYKPFQAFLAFDKSGAGFNPIKDKRVIAQLLTENKEI